MRLLEEVCSIFSPHQHQPQAPESDGRRYCATCGAYVAPGTESGRSPTARFFEATLPDGTPLFVQVAVKDRFVQWMNRWERWPEGLRAGLFTYVLTQGWAHTDVYADPQALPADALA